MNKTLLLTTVFLASITCFSQNETGSGFSIVDPGNQTVNIPFDLEIENARYNGDALDGSSDDYLVTVNDTTNDIELKRLPQAPFENGELTIEDIILENAGLINIMVEIRARFGGFKMTENIDVNVDEDDTYEWTGKVSSNWHDPDNWVPNSVPGEDDNVRIPVVDKGNYYPVISNSNATINSLAIASGAQLIVEDSILTLKGPEDSRIRGTLRIEDAELTITPSGKVSSTGTIINLATEGLILESDDSGSASLIHNNENVEATVQRYIAGDKTFHLISTPVEGRSIQDFLDGNEGIIAEGTLNGEEIYAMQHYIEAEDKWSPFYIKGDPELKNILMEPGIMYAVGLASPGTITFEGTLTYQKVIHQITYSHPNGNGWNGIGNPFACALNVNDGEGSFLHVNSDSLHDENKAVYIWCPENEQYIPINYTPISSQNYVASGQGFMVRAKEGEEGEIAEFDITFDTGMRAHEDPQFRKKIKNPYGWHNIIVEIANGKGQSLTTALAFNKNMTAGLDVGYDAGLFSDNPGFKFYSRMPGGISDLNLAIQALPKLWSYDAEISVAIPLGIVYNEGGQITFSASSMTLPGNVTPMLEDNETGIFTNLSAEDYTAHIPANADPLGRFYLYMETSPKQHKTEGKGKELSEEPGIRQYEPSITVYPNPCGGQFFADISLSKPAAMKFEMYDMPGNKVMNMPVKQFGEGSHSVAFNKQHLVPGIYIMKIKGYCTKNRSLTFEINKRILIKK